MIPTSYVAMTGDNLRGPRFLCYGKEGLPTWVTSKMIDHAERFDNTADAWLMADDWSDFYRSKGYSGQFDVIEKVDLLGGEEGWQIVARADA